jgi:hypothetical protein
MILKVHLEGGASHDVGDEIWQETLGDAIRAEAESIVYTAGPDLLAAGYNQLRDRIVAEMSGALSEVGDTTERLTASCTRSSKPPGSKTTTIG